MSSAKLKKLDRQIKKIRKAAEELKALCGGIQAIQCNANRILASVKMLEINVSDLLDLDR
ncbi:MAG: hypothetical protein N3G78_04195 [Desulfobacterota bacterium]|nr:hypothetical protein [Thermodesulfobacteriota bacterium]